VTIWLVRHAKAGERRKWTGPDELRPLSKTGQRQARALVAVMVESAGSEHIARVVSSPFVRCVQTVEPLAARLSLEVETADALVEGASLADALRLVDKCASDNAVLCTHGDVLGELLDHYELQGLQRPHDKLEKGAAWKVDLADAEARAITYLSPRRR
jgi:8-oxo-dGTP diphosphatase